MRKLKLLIGILLGCASTFAQQRSVTGTIQDQNSMPIAGANIIVKGTTTGTLSDFDGKFTIKLSNGSETIQVSYIGYASQEVDLTGKSNVKVTLQEDISQLDEVVVVGYGTQKVRDITGAIGVFDGDALSEKKTTQVSTALQGSIAGVTVSRSSGAPGNTGDILIRGITSLGSSSPLVLIDGIPGGIDDVNPNDIESISVLKDAASAAIYGSRAAAGVILITTKRAKTGKAVFSYDVDAGFQMLGKLPEFADAQTYMRLLAERQVNDGQTPTYDEDTINNWLINNATNPDEYPNSDWQSTFFKNAALQTRHNLSMSIGSENLKSKASIGWLEQGALTPNRNYKRLNIRLNNNYDFSDKLSAIFDVGFKRTNVRTPTQGTDIFQVYRLAPIWDNFYEDGRYAPARNGNNPLANANEGGNTDNQYNSLTARMGLVFEPIKNLTLKAIIAPSLDFDRETVFNKIVYYGVAEDPTLPGTVTSGGTDNTLRERSNKSETLNIQATANYDFTIRDNHKFGVLAGFEDNRFQNENLLVGRDGYIFVDYPVINAGSTEIQTTGGNGYETALRSFFGRVTYNFKDRYNLQFNARYDGSSRFGSDNRWGFFPSVAAAWTVSEEPFLKNFFKDSYLKFRGSWGRLGNQQIGNYPYISELTLGNNLFYNGDAIVPLPTGDIRTINFPDITWETTESYNVGIDLKVLNDRLSLTADGYKKNTYDLLRKIDIPLVSGLNPNFTNVAEIETYGWDATLGWRDRKGEFKYRVSVNVTDSKTKVVNLAGTADLGEKSLIEGEEYNVFYGYKALGFLSQEDLDNGVALVNGKEQPGDMRYEDISGPDGIPDGTISAEYDRVPLKSSRPHYIYGGNIGFDYKGFDFSTSFQGVAKQTRYYESFITQPFMNQTGNIPKAVIDNHWTPDNPNAAYPRLTDKNSGINYRLSDYWLRTAAYFRISNITFGYTLPKDVIKSIGMSSLRVYVTGNDVFLSTKYPKGYDPEIGVTASPIASTYLLGLNVKF